METDTISAAQEDRLDAVIARLARAAPVEKIILFGSRARGDYHPDSDYDLCVVLRDGIPAGQFTGISLWREVSDCGLSLNIVPLRRSRFDGERSNPMTFSHEIARHGRVLFSSRAAASLR